MTENGITNYDNDNWRQHALCRGAGADEFFLEGRGVTTAYFECRLLCFRCPVQKQCLDFAVDNSIVDGLWGGLSYRERLVYARGERGYQLSLLEVIKSSRKTMTVPYLAQKLRMAEEEVRVELARSLETARRGKR